MGPIKRILKGWGLIWRTAFAKLVFDLAGFSETAINDRRNLDEFLKYL